MSGAQEPGWGDIDEVLSGLVDVQRLVTLLRERHRRTVSDAPTRLQRFTLMLIGEHRTLSVSELTDALAVGAATASQLVRTLEDRGWLRRSLDPADRRRHRLALTAEGRRVVDEQRERHRRWLRAVLERLTPEERAHLLAIVRKIAGLAASDPSLLRDEP
jgi:DNA-binding MarR family transcriptional regulator